jgi:hypothetical protein
MARDLGGLRAIKNRLVTSGHWAWLLFLESRNPTTGALEAFRFTSAGRDLTWSTTSLGVPVTWKPAPFSVGQIEEESDGSIPAISVTLANVRDDLVEKLLERDFLEGQRAALILVNTAELDDPRAHVRLDGTIGDVRVTELAISFQISADPLFELETPSTRVQDDACGNVYGGAGCEFPIELLDPDRSILGDCRKRLADCRLRRNLAIAEGHSPVLWPLNFAAEPGVANS